MRLAKLAVLAALIAAPANAQSLLGNVVGTVGGVVSGVTETASEITGSITGGDSAEASPSQARTGRGGAVMPVGIPTKGAGCQRVRFPGLPGATFGVDRVQIRTLKTCIEPHVQSVAMVKQVPAIVEALKAKGYDLDDLVTFEAKDDGLLLLYVYKRG